MTVLFIVNPLSQKVAQKGSVLTEIAKDPKQYFDIAEVSLSLLHTKKGFKPAIDMGVKLTAQHIIIEGGDGSVQGVLTEYLRQRHKFPTPPKFSIVAGGMTNQIAKNIGIKHRRIATVIKAINTPIQESRNQSLLDVKQGDTHHYGFLFSSGAVPMITDYTKSKIHRRGIGGSLAVAGGILRGIRGQDGDVLQTTPISLQSERYQFRENHLGTLVTTLSGLILKLDPFWGSEDAPLRVLYAGENTQNLPKNVLGLWQGRKHKDRAPDGLYSWNTHHLNYHYSGPVILDGETLSFSDANFEITATDPIKFVY